MNEPTIDPIARGPHPVGVRTTTVADPKRDGRALPVEVWYPADPRHRGADLDRSTMDAFRVPVPGGATTKQAAVRDAAAADAPPFPLLVCSHGHAGYRCASTFYTTHLASHGFVVVAPDHVGDTMLEVLSTPRERQGVVALQSAMERPQDVSSVLDAALDASSPLGEFTRSRVDASRIGVTGHSFGGFTSLVSTVFDDRIRACLPLAPPGVLDPKVDPLKAGDSYRGLPLGERSVPTLVVAADRDSLCLLAGIEALFARLAQPKTLAVLAPADHFHFADAARMAHQLFASFLTSGATGHRPILLPPFEDLLDEETGHAITRGLATAFFRRHLVAETDAEDGALGAVAARFAGHVELR